MALEHSFDIEYSEFQHLENYYNARNIPPEIIAESFVYTEDFKKVVLGQNVIVIGPRGCGKTTLFKMLSPKALENWSTKNQQHKAIKDSYRDITIFIPADLLWKDQIEEIQRNLENFPKWKELVTSIYVNINILTAFINSIVEHLQIKTNSTQSVQAKFVKKIYENWNLQPGTNILSAVKSALKRKLILINGFARKVYYEGLNEGQLKAEFDKINENGFYYLDFTSALSIGTSLYSEVFNSGKDNTWVLCFDELELVPNEIIGKLIGQLRNSPQEFTFKLSLAPIFDFKVESAIITPMEGSDFEVVRMWPFDASDDFISKKNKFKDFTKRLFISKLNRAYYKSGKLDQPINEKSLVDIFSELDYKYSLGDYPFVKNGLYDKEKEYYEKNSLTWWAFKTLATNSLHFAQYLDDVKINTENPVPRTDNQKSEVLRKVRELAICRLVFMRPTGQALRTRKVYPIYYGTSTIYSICEGNPRHAAALFSLMSNHFSISKGRIRINERNQIRCIVSLSEKFYHRILSFSDKYVESRPDLKSRDWYLHTIVDRIGNYISNEIYSRNVFKSNPASCFIIDPGIPDEMIPVIKLGINVGAFILLKTKKSTMFTDLRNEKIRLNYLLCPKYKLPLRQYQTVSLSTALKLNVDIKLKFNDPNQESIKFDKNEN